MPLKGRGRLISSEEARDQLHMSARAIYVSRHPGLMQLLMMNKK